LRSTRRLSVAKMFPLIVLGYLGMQAYAMFRAYTGLALAPASIPWLAAFVVLMTFMPALLWRIERRGGHYSAEVVAWIGDSWMGVVVLFFWIALGLDGVGWAGAAAPALLA